MRKISYMYQVSGGCNHRHLCIECGQCVKDETTKHYACMKHPEGMEWNPYWMACKCFTEEKYKPATKSRKKKMTKNIHQMTIMELLGAEA